MTTITAAGEQSSVRVVLRRAAGPDEEVELTLHHQAATGADLLEALRTHEQGTAIERAEADAGVARTHTISIDGHCVPPGLPLRAGRLRRGSTVELGAPHDDEQALGRQRGPKLWLRTVAGPDAGRELPLRTGAQVVGRSRDADLCIEDPTLARYQAVLEVDAHGNVGLTDLGSSRASRVRLSDGADACAVAVGDELLLGATSAVVVRAADHEDHDAGPGRDRSVAEMTAPSAAGPQWTAPLHRPPRPPVPAPPEPVRAPARGAAPEVPVVAGSAAVVVTLIAGAFVALVLGQPAFLLLSAVGAAGTLGAGLWYRGKRHARRRAGRRQADGELARFASELSAHQAEQAARHRALAFELSDAVRAAYSRGQALWARRRDDPGAYTAVVGRGERVVPPLLTGPPSVGGPVLAGRDDTRDVQPLASEAWALVEAASVLPDMPVTVDLGRGELVGIVGPAPAARALLRSLVLQLVTAHGPADLLVASLDAKARGDGSRATTAMSEAAWLAWLPHTEDPSSGERLVASGAEVDAMLAGLDRSAEPALPHLVLVIDDPALLAARNTAARRLLSHDPSAAALVVADDVAALPSTSRTVVQVRADGTASIQRPGHGGLAEHVRPAGASFATARHVALALAGLHDPERPGGGRCLPTAVSLTDLVGPIDDPDVLRDRWRSAGDDPPLRTRLALAVDGPVEIDLVRDGPHMLVAGTTGAGKSELLRALITGLAAGSGPEHLAFVLVDYKGGAAFDACARLPHVVGTATDLDERLAERALRSLHAELRRREAMLRDAGAPDLTSYRSVPGRSPIPRLVVVVDEFATLAADLPGFIPSLVAVAQRGRSLGVHLVLATQRPAGAVSDDIRANTTIRVALRVQDPADSFDVVGDAAAAAIPRHRPGRAVIRFGPGDLVAVQVASVSLPTVPAPGHAVTIDDPTSTRAPVGPPALDGVVGVLTAAAQSSVLPPRPWLPPLPPHVALDDLPPGASGVVDDPDHQAQGPWTWDRRKGHALCIGAVGSGTTTALTALATAAAAATPPGGLHLYVVGADPALCSLESLPHTGSVIAPADDERQARLLRHLGRRLPRRGGESAGPPILLVVDRLAGWRADVAARLGPDAADLLDRILVDGPSAGIVVAGGLDRPGALPLAVSGAVGERLVFCLADAADAVAAGLRPSSVSSLPPGRACLAGDGRELQVAQPAASTVAAVAKLWGLVDVAVRPPDIRCLPARVAADDLPLPVARRPAAHSDGRPPLALVIGTDGETLDPACLELHPGDHLLVAGPARSGRSTTLAVLARMAIRADPSVAVAALVPRRPGTHPLRPFAPCATVAELAEAVAAVPAHRPLLVVIDDVELVDDADGVLAGLLNGDANVVAAGRTDAIRSGYGHWAQELRRRRRGLLLAPESDLDGDLFGISLPRWPLAPKATGRGYLVMDGRGTLVQVAVPVSHPWDGAE